MLPIYPVPGPFIDNESFSNDKSLDAFCTNRKLRSMKMETGREKERVLIFVGH